MYHPWQKSDPAADAILKLIEERERKEVENYPHDDQANWNIVSYKNVGNGRDSRRVEQESPTGDWRGRSGHYSDQRAEVYMERSRKEGMHAEKWGKKVADLDKDLRAEFEAVKWRVRKRSSSSDERVSRSKRRHESPDKSKGKRDRKRDSRSVSGDRKRERRHNRSRSGSRSKKRNRSSSRDRKRGRSGSRDKKRDRSDRRKSRSRSGSSNGRRKRSPSRDRKRDRSGSRDRKRESRSKDSGSKRDASPRRHSPAKVVQPAPENSAIAAETTNEILSKFVSIMQDAKGQSVQKIPYRDVLPEFDPCNNGHAILTWLIRVDDVAKLFGWEEKEIIQYALPKLVGDAKTWYQTLIDIPYSWADWKKKLLAQFPCPNFAELLRQLHLRKALASETLETYYFAKMVLVNKCGFRGRQAVDCILQGIQNEQLRRCALDAQCNEPEELLIYLKTADSLRTVSNVPVVPVPEKNVVKKVIPKVNVICHFCKQAGHKAHVCRLKTRAANKLPIPKEPKAKREHRLCFNCHKPGHMADKCWFPPNFAQSGGATTSTANTANNTNTGNNGTGNMGVGGGANMGFLAPPGVEDEYYPPNL